MFLDLRFFPEALPISFTTEDFWQSGPPLSGHSLQRVLQMCYNMSVTQIKQNCHVIKVEPLLKITKIYKTTPIV